MDDVDGVGRRWRRHLAPERNVSAFGNLRSGTDDRAAIHGDAFVREHLPQRALRGSRMPCHEDVGKPGHVRLRRPAWLRSSARRSRATAAGRAAVRAGGSSGRARRSPPPPRSIATSRDRATRRSARPASLRCRARAGSTRRGRRVAGGSPGARQGRAATPARARGRARRWRRCRRSARSASRARRKS